MIGQKKLKANIKELIDKGKFPRFFILVGDKGSERREVADYIAECLHCEIYESDITVEAVRKTISDSYKVSSPIIYLFDNARDMSISAQNALLKVTEEPPNNAYFILLLEDRNDTLETIRSRAAIDDMQPYSKNELYEYFNSKYNETESYRRLVLELCDTPGEIDKLQKYRADEFYGFVQKVLNNISEVTLANALKIADSIAFKDEEDKYDMALFMKMLIKVVMDILNSDHEPISSETLCVWGEIVNATTVCLSTMRKTKSVNKSALFDIWILNVRKIYGHKA